MMSDFLFFTARPMTPPAAGSFFHVALAVSGSLMAAAVSCFLARSSRLRPERILFLSGFILLILECYKQAFLYTVVNGGRYDWWYFPFQLCSTPMYICLLYPFLSVRAPRQTAIQKALATYLEAFGLLGGIMALAFPEGFLTGYLSLTLHGFLWHFLLIFIGIYCAKKGLSDFSEHGFARAVLFYVLFCLIASVINTAVQLKVYPESYADMFYINCFFPSEQPVFDRISLLLGNIWGHLAYMLTSCIGAWLIHCVWKKCAQGKENQQP